MPYRFSASVFHCDILPNMFFLVHQVVVVQLKEQHFTQKGEEMEKLQALKIV